jgi:hypothetical protein
VDSDTLLDGVGGVDELVDAPESEFELELQERMAELAADEAAADEAMVAAYEDRIDGELAMVMDGWEGGW